MRRLLLDMSLTVLHHGHTRLLKKASEMGYVILGLPSDEDIHKHKGFIPKLTFENRQEIARSIKWVDEVMECPWPVDKIFLDDHNIDYLVRGDLDHYNIHSEKPNVVPLSRIKLFSRTLGISSTILRGF
tara:strand:- start:43 stop:429 length:387 start_codon:yes stop_codon:yes gene_type:complete